MFQELWASASLSPTDLQHSAAMFHVRKFVATFSICSLNPVYRLKRNQLSTGTNLCRMSENTRPRSSLWTQVQWYSQPGVTLFLCHTVVERVNGSSGLLGDDYAVLGLNTHCIKVLGWTWTETTKKICKVCVLFSCLRSEGVNCSFVLRRQSYYKESLS